MPKLELLLFLVSFCPEAKADLASQVKSLLGLLAPEPPIGEPWPKIPGPRIEVTLLSQLSHSLCRIVFALLGQALLAFIWPSG